MNLNLIMNVFRPMQVKIDEKTPQIAFPTVAVRQKHGMPKSKPYILPPIENGCETCGMKIK